LECRRVPSHARGSYTPLVCLAEPVRRVTAGLRALLPETKEYLADLSPKGLKRDSFSVDCNCDDLRSMPTLTVPNSQMPATVPT
jgi:hypothetical protein